MASQIDTVRKLHAPSLVKVPDTFDVDVICQHCTDLVRGAVQKLDKDLAANTPDIQYPCETALSAGSTEDSARAEAEKIRGDYFDAREANLREELEYIEAVRALNGDDDAPEEGTPEPEKPEPKKPARKAPARKAPAKKPAPEPEKAEEPAPESEPEPEKAEEPAPEPSDEDDSWDF